MYRLLSILILCSPCMQGTYITMYPYGDVSKGAVEENAALETSSRFSARLVLLFPLPPTLSTPFFNTSINCTAPLMVQSLAWTRERERAGGRANTSHVNECERLCRVIGTYYVRSMYPKIKTGVVRLCEQQPTCWKTRPKVRCWVCVCVPPCPYNWPYR